MNVGELTTSITLLALVTSSELNDEELRIFIAMLLQLQYTLNTILVSRETLETKQGQQQEQQQEQDQEQQQLQERPLSR